MTNFVHQRPSFRPRVPALLMLLLASCGGEELVLPDEGVPTSIVVVDGNGQSGTIGSALGEPIVVRVLDVQGRPVQGQQVTFTVMTGGGLVAPLTPTTNANGEASTSWTLGPAAGTQQLQARATGGAAPANLSVAINAIASASAAAAIEAVSGGGQSATAGSTLPDSLVVRVTDAAGNPVAGIAVTWTVTDGGTVSDASTVTGPDGRTGVRRTLGTTAGPQSTVATVAGLTGSPVTFPATATFGSAGRLVVVQQPSATAASGAVFARQPHVQVRDANGNDVPEGGLTITAQLNIGSGSLVGIQTAITNGTGLASFNNLGISGPAGSYSLNFSGENLNGTDSEPITLTAGAATRLVFSVQPSDATAGASIAPAVQITVQDALGQTVTSATTAVSLSIGTNPGSGTLGGTTTVNAVAGVATFPNLAINRAAAGYRLAAAAPGLAGATSSTFDIVAGPAANMASSATIPGTTTAGSVVVPDAAVRVTDALGNPVAGITVTFAALNGGSVAGETQTTTVQGNATVGSWTIGGTAGIGYQLRASAAGLTPVVFTTTAAAGAAGQLTIETEPAGTAQSGVALSPQPSVQLRDGLGNPVNQAGIAISAQFASGPTGILSNATTSTNGSGRATFSGLTITGPAGTYTLAFGGPGIEGVISSPIVLGSGSATKLGMITQPPASVENGALLDPSPIVELQDAAGNAVGTSGVNIDVAIVSGPGTLSGTLTATTNSSGQAIFPNLRITGAVGSRTLRFSADIPVTTVNATPVIVTPGPVSATNSSISAVPSTIVASTPGTGGATITVTARDQSNNSIAGATVVLNSVQGSGSFGPVALTGPTGSTTASYTSTVAGAKIIGATINGVPIADQQPITVTAAGVAVGNSDFTVSPGTITANGAGATATVTARDEFGNLVDNADVIISFASGLASPSNGQTNDGVFTSTITSGNVGTHAVSATVEGQSLLDQSITVIAIATTTSVISSGSPSIAGESVTFTATVSASSTPSGIVTFHDGGTCEAPGVTLGNDALSGGTASVTTGALSAGAHTIIACYPGNSLFAASAGSVAQTVNEPANEAPTAIDHAYGATEDEALVVAAAGVLAGASDGDGTITGAVAGTGPAHGQLVLGSDGSFTYTPDDDYSGPDAFTYRAVDDDGAQSAAATVTLAVGAINDAPSFSPGPPQSASSSDGPRSVPGWADAISPGPGESGQAVTFDVTTSNDAAFASLPAVAANGTLSYEAASVADVTEVTVTITARDDGGTANGGVDAGLPVQVTFTIQP